MESIARGLVIAGALLVALGGVLWLAPQLLGPLGRLPGDLRIERPGFRLYLPVTTCLLLSSVFTLLSWLVARLR